eukprot:4821601-Prorocentrum_lima.AAC.1
MGEQARLYRDGIPPDLVSLPTPSWDPEEAGWCFSVGSWGQRFWLARQGQWLCYRSLGRRSSSPGLGGPSWCLEAPPTVLDPGLGSAAPAA